MSSVPLKELKESVLEDRFKLLTWTKVNIKVTHSNGVCYETPGVLFLEKKLSNLIVDGHRPIVPILSIAIHNKQSVRKPIKVYHFFLVLL